MESVLEEKSEYDLVSQEKPSKGQKSSKIPKSSKIKNDDHEEKSKDEKSLRQDESIEEEKISKEKNPLSEDLKQQKKEKNLAKLQEISKRKEFLFHRINVSLRTKIQISTELKKLKFAILENKINCIFAEKKKKFQEEFLISLEETKRKVSEIEKNLNFSLKNNFLNERKETLEEKKKKLTKIRRNCLEYQIKIEIANNNNNLNDKDKKIEQKVEMEIFLMKILGKIIENDKMEAFLEKNYELINENKKKSKFTCLITFLQVWTKEISAIQDEIYQKEEELTENINKFNKSEKVHNIEKILDEYFKESKNFLGFRQKCVDKLKKKSAEEIVNYLQEIDLKIKNIDTNNQIFDKIKKENQNYQDDIDLLMSKWEETIKLEMEIKKKFEFPNILEKNNNLILLREKIIENSEISLILQTLEIFDSIKDELVGISKFKEIQIFEEDSLTNLEKIWVKLEILEEFKPEDEDFQQKLKNEDFEQKLHQAEIIKMSLEKEIENLDEIELSETKRNIFEMWKAKVLGILKEKEKKWKENFIEKTEDENILKKLKDESEKLQKVKRKLKENIAREKTELARFLKNEKELRKKIDI